jgi:hypothetical protein
VTYIYAHTHKCIYTYIHWYIHKYKFIYTTLKPFEYYKLRISYIVARNILQEGQQGKFSLTSLFEKYVSPLNFLVIFLFPVPPKAGRLEPSTYSWRWLSLPPCCCTWSIFKHFIFFLTYAWAFELECYITLSWKVL